jgi:hypothetical protein
MIPEEEPAVEDDGLFDDHEADFAEPGQSGDYVLSRPLPPVVSGPS